MIYYRMNPRYKKTSSGKTMTVILDLNNSDPTSWATYADDAVGMTAGSDAWDDFFGHYPCILENGAELGKLNRNNFAQYEDGTTAPITTIGKDVMICFPRRGIKLEYLDENTLSVSMTNEDNKEGYSYWAHSYSNSGAGYEHAACDKFYFGAYKGYNSSSRLYSTSGVAPTASVTIVNFRTYAQARGTGYEQSGFFQLTFRQVMYLLKYKGQNAQVAIGRGWVDGNSSAHTTGGTNTRGMDWGESTGKDQMKLFGLEDFYGNIYEFIDGCSVIKQGTSNIEIGFADGNYTSPFYKIGTFSSTGMVCSGFIRYPFKLSGMTSDDINLAGFIPRVFSRYSTTYGSSQKYFCDYGGITMNNMIGGTFGGYYQGTEQPGVFNLTLDTSSNSANVQTGARLMYMHVAE